MDDRPVIHLHPLHPVHCQTQRRNAHEYHHAPIERRQLHWRRVGPEGPEENEQGVRQADDVNRDTEAAQAPASRGQELRVVEAAVEDAADGREIREHQGDDLKGDDGVEGDGGAKVDEGEESGDQAGEGDGVGGDLLHRVHVGDPLGEREAFVAGKGEGLTGGRGVERDVTRDDEDQEEDCEGVDAARGHRVTEDVEEGIGGGIGDGVVDGLDAE